MDFDKEIDARGLKCPLPILRCKKGLSDMDAAQVLKITVTDVGAVKDFQAFCKQTGHALLSLIETDETNLNKEFVFFIRKREA